MALTGAEPIGSMGTDTPPAVLSKRPRLLYDYFKQNFAQVTNPPLDAIREEIVTSVQRIMGPEQNLLEPSPASCRHIQLPLPGHRQRRARQAHPRQRRRRHAGLRLHGHPRTVRSGRWRRRRWRRPSSGCAARRPRRSRPARASLVLSDRDADHRMAPIPSLLLVSAVHHHLVRTKERLRVALVVETGDAREVHHVALLLGYGAAAVNPYLAFETIENLIRRGTITGIEPRQAIRNYVGALVKGVLKIMSKMGISTVGAYTAAQVFEAFGLATDVLDEYFTGTSSKLGGVGLDVIAARGRGAPPPRAPGEPDRPGRTGGSRSAASTPTAARASCTCSRRRPCSCCSTRRRPRREDVYREYVDRGASGSTARAARCAGCSSCAPRAARRSRWTRSSRSSRSSSASTPARCPTARSARRRTRPSPSR